MGMPQEKPYQMGVSGLMWNYLAVLYMKKIRYLTKFNQIRGSLSLVTFTVYDRLHYEALVKEQSNRVCEFV